MEQFKVGDYVVHNGVICKILRLAGKDGKVVVDKSPRRASPEELRKATPKERAVYFLSEMPDSDYEGIFAILQYYDTQLGLLDKNHENKPYNRVVNEAYLEKKCDNLQTQCFVMYRFLKRLWG